IGHAGEEFTVAAGFDAPDPLAVGVHSTDLGTAGNIPPQKAAVVAAGDKSTAGQSHARDIALVLSQSLEFRLGLAQVHFVDLEIRTTQEQPLAVGHPDDAE